MRHLIEKIRISNHLQMQAPVLKNDDGNDATLIYKYVFKKTKKTSFFIPGNYIGHILLLEKIRR